MQLELDILPKAVIWTRQQHWDSLGYEGPAPGRYCDIHTLIVPLETGGTIYAYTEQCKLIEKRDDGRWVAEIAMGIVHGHKWSKDGTRVLLSEDEIWPPMKLPNDKRSEIHEGVYI